MNKVETLIFQKERLLHRLKDVTRMLEAVRLDAGLSDQQIDRLHLAKSLIAEVETTEIPAE